MAQILADLGMGPLVVAAGLLHDTVEDTDYTLDECRAEFGDTVTGLVDGVTKLSKMDTAIPPRRDHPQNGGGDEPRRARAGGQARRPCAQRPYMALRQAVERAEKGT